MKPPHTVYFDTSFFIGLLENEKNRQSDCKDVVRWEREQNSVIHTSFLTVDEFLVRHYDLSRKLPDCDLKANEIIAQLREIANIYGLNDDVTKESARLQSVWGEHRMTQKPALPRDRKMRWDMIHLATAHVLRSVRVYAFDGPWNDFPKAEIPNIGKIIVPALSPQIQLDQDRGQSVLFDADGNTKTTAISDEVPVSTEALTDVKVPAEESQPQQTKTEVEPGTQEAVTEDRPSENGSLGDL